jgi:hypothetical protein
MPIFRKAWTTYRKGREYVSSLEEHGNSWALSAVDALESRNQRKTRALIAAGGIVATIGIWLAHWFYPYVLDNLVQLQSKLLFLFAFAAVMAPPFAAAFSIFSIIFPQANEPVKNDAEPMSAYLYRERADTKWKIVFAAALIGAVNFLLLLITSESP